LDLAPKLERIVNKPEEMAHSCNGYRSVYSTGGELQSKAATRSE